MFRRALENVRPRVEVKSPARGWRHLPGADRGAPRARQRSLAMRWLARTTPARARARACARSWPNEIIDAANERGESVKKREDTHRMADANKAFSHYRW